MRYVVFPHRVKIEKNTFKTYGIIVVDKFLPVRIMKDISTDYKIICKLVKKLNNGKVEFVHIDDIIEDFIIENV